MTRELILATALSLGTGTAFCGEATMLPPIQYDYPFPGPIIITHKPTLKGICPTNVCACAQRYAHVCQIWVSDEPLMKMLGCKYDARTLRHEIGHCNGWGNDHASARSPNVELGDSAVFHPDYAIDAAQISEGPDVIERFMEYGRRRLEEMGEE